jgi:putative transposase
MIRAQCYQLRTVGLVAKKTKARPKEVQRAIEVKCDLNASKLTELRAVFSIYSRLVAYYSDLMTSAFWNDEFLFQRPALRKEDLPFDVPLSQRFLEAAHNQAYSAHASHRALLKEQLARQVLRLPYSSEDVSVMLAVVRKGAYPSGDGPLGQVWVCRWRAADGSLSYSPVLNEFGFKEPVDTTVRLEHARVLRHLVKAAVKRGFRLPRLGATSTMMLDLKLARLKESTSTTHFDHWLKVSSTTPRKLIDVPITLDERVPDPGVVKQVHFSFPKTPEDPALRGRLVTVVPTAEVRTSGDVLGLDWGLGSLFADSDGNHHGRRFLSWLRERDTELTELEAVLNRKHTKHKESRRWRKLTRRIQDHTKNEVNRVLNKLGHDGVCEIVVESLDFRGGGLSRSLNRLLSRAGRGAVKEKLIDLELTRGITVTRVNPAYTSQECSSCGFVSKSNRRGKHFFCRHCQTALHADTNAARVILRRSRDGLTWAGCRKEFIRAELERMFHARHGYAMASVP